MSESVYRVQHDDEAKRAKYQVTTQDKSKSTKDEKVAVNEEHDGDVVVMSQTDPDGTMCRTGLDNISLMSMLDSSEVQMTGRCL